MSSGELTLMEITRRFSTEEAAREYFERLRWPEGPFCPHCGNCAQDRIYRLTPNPKAKIRPGMFKCAECRETFTVTVNTVMEDSHVPLNKWLIAFYMICASKTQISALQIQRHLELGSYRTAWFLCHRIRFALKTNEPGDLLKGTVEADETWIGGKRRGKGRGYTGNKTAVVSLVERYGRVRSEVVEMVSGDKLGKLLRQNIAPTANLNTDESPLYAAAGNDFASHDTVNHSVEEYARTDAATGRKVTTNTVEGYFGNVKRSIDGTHHHVGRKHIPLYLAETDYKYNTRKASDGARTAGAIRSVEGKRLTLRPMKGAAKAGSDR